MDQRECQIHNIPNLSEGHDKIANLTAKQRVKLWLKRIITPNVKRKLKVYLSRIAKPKRNEAFLPLTGGSRQTTAPPVLDPPIPATWLVSGVSDSLAPLPPTPPKTRFQSGDLVRIRPIEEIKETLNTWDELKGCGFMDEMEPYCGTVQRVMKPVTRFVDERDYQVKKTRGIYLLEGLICQGTKLYGRCDRSCFFFWREEWLEPYQEERMI